jgi:hypothetical protein
VRQIDPDQPVENIRTLEGVVSRTLAPRRFNLTLLGAFALLAVTLAAVGVHGLLAQSVAERRGEIGVRLAPGASPGAIVCLVTGGVLRSVALGVAGGLAGAWASARVLQRFVFGVSQVLGNGSGTTLSVQPSVTVTLLPCGGLFDQHAVLVAARGPRIADGAGGNRSRPQDPVAGAGVEQREDVGMLQCGGSRISAWNLWPELLPARRAVLFTIRRIQGMETAEVVVLDLATGTRRVLVRGGSHARYTPSGHLVYAAAGSLRAVAFDLATLETRGTPVPVIPDVLVAHPCVGPDYTLARRSDRETRPPLPPRALRDAMVAADEEPSVLSHPAARARSHRSHDLRGRGDAPNRRPGRAFAPTRELRHHDRIAPRTDGRGGDRDNE